jgi:hypothetical protein
LAESKEKGRQNADRSRRATESTIQQGDMVLQQQPMQNKLSTTFELEPYTIVDRKGTSVVLKRNSKKAIRHVSFVKLWIQPQSGQWTTSDRDTDRADPACT